MDGKHMPCHKPPGPPTNLTLLFIDQTSVILSWNAPMRSENDRSDTQFHNDVVFKVKCQSCTSNVVFNPSHDVFNDTKLTLTNLEPVTTYTVQIHSLNGPSYSITNQFRNMTFGHSFDGTDSPPTQSRHGDGFWGDTKTEFAEITFTTESAILSTVFNVK